MGSLTRRRALALMALGTLGACAPSVETPTTMQHTTAATATPEPTVEPTPSATPSSAPTPSFSRLRAFVASDRAEHVWVLSVRPGEITVEGKVGVGRMPHNLAVSPDGRWVAAGNRMGASVSIIDPIALKELARVPVGQQPHDLTWSPDSRTLFVGHERDMIIARIEAPTWKALPPLTVTVPQHDLAISAARPTELYFTVTNSNAADHLRVYDLETGRITKFAVQDVHDAFFTPDGSEIWTTSSGFLNVMSDRLVAHDPATKKVKDEFRFGGRYPFHTMKQNRDGLFFPPAGTPMVLSDHAGPSLLFVDPVRRAIVGETKVGPQPFHTTYDPLGGRLLVTSNEDGAVRAIDLATRKVTATIAVAGAHGIVAVPIP